MANNPGLEVRTVRPEDYAEVGELLVNVYVGEGFSPVERTPGLRNAEPLATEGQLLVAREVQAGLLGTVVLFRGGTHHAEVAREQEAEIRLLAVAPVARGRGVGEALVAECIRRARHLGCQRLVLSTQPTMASAQRLYERLGFVRVPERDWSKAGSPRLVYTLELAQSR
ncbi:GNAT family N-acetyltransferase [Archangium violaceum]|uniref:GNAT family N-acetyltransferase n=1 Tax=Archangium violaceum TaxID=83451 RepID=UPI002B2C47C3|nr:GNAT family N-acetyltransferase [Archangium gephyra]